MEDNYGHVARIFEDAKKNGYKIQNFNTGVRHNKKGYYQYVEVTYIVPYILDSKSDPEDQKEEVNKNEV